MVGWLVGLGIMAKGGLCQQKSALWSHATAGTKLSLFNIGRDMYKLTIHEPHSATYIPVTREVQDIQLHTSNKGGTGYSATHQ